jgi:RNA polymerase sigma-70 factor, ECF subfamily
MSVQAEKNLSPTPRANAAGAPDDRELVRTAKSGDLAAYEALVTRHERRIYGLTRRITGSDEDAQDATQQTFLSVIQGLAGFRETSAFSTWLTTIAVNAALKIVRKRRGLPTTSLDAATGQADDGRVAHPQYIADWRDTPDRLAQHAETRRLLDEAIRELNPGHRAVFLLRDVEGLSVKETAAALGLSAASVKVRLLRARMQLRERLTRAFGDSNRRYAPDAHAPF